MMVTRLPASEARESIDVSEVVKVVLVRRTRGVFTSVSTAEIILSRSESSVLIS
jgi:hypothetical protein